MAIPHFNNLFCTQHYLLGFLQNIESLKEIRDTAILTPIQNHSKFYEQKQWNLLCRTLCLGSIWESLSCPVCAGPWFKPAPCSAALPQSRAGRAAVKPLKGTFITPLVVKIFFKPVISYKHHIKAILVKQINCSPWIPKIMRFPQNPTESVCHIPSQMENRHVKGLSKCHM